MYRATFRNAKLQTATTHSLRGSGGHAVDVRGKFVALWALICSNGEGSLFY